MGNAILMLAKFVHFIEWIWWVALLNHQREPPVVPEKLYSYVSAAIC